MNAPSNVASDEAPTVEMRVTADQEFEIVLKPISHPELGEIRIDENLFAIGRTESPFVGYAPEIIADLSRRHARIFSEYGAVYLADLDSKNGTTVNGADVRQRTTRLQHGDELCFGRALSYRVEMAARAPTQPRASKLLSMTLSPERGDLGIQPIVVTQFPFLISKADATFSRYKDAYPHQVNYISRRHAHIFLKSGSPFVEDLGSTNGTFVGGKRLDEHAVPLEDGDVIAFGGHHFVYKVSLQREQFAVEPTVTMFGPVVRDATHVSSDVDKTTFVTAADSFLDIFCVDHGVENDDAVSNDELKESDDARMGKSEETSGRRARGKFAVFLSELSEAFGGSERIAVRRAIRWGILVVALLAMFVMALYVRGAPERELDALLASGEYARAAVAADQYLARHPGNAEVEALSKEALLKANVPTWIRMVRARDFDRASAVLVGMKELGSRNPDLPPLVSELEWIGDLEKFVMSRGGVDAPIRIYTDEEKIKLLLKQWDVDRPKHQRAFTTISLHVPEFKDAYADALSHLRRLQSDASVYLPAMERLKTTISTELDRGRPETLEAVLKEYEEKYPRLGGLDSVRQDLRQYTQFQNEARAQRLGPLITLMRKAPFSTPPFKARFQTLATSRQLPSAEVVQQYDAISNAWRAGNTTQAIAALQKMDAGPWADAAARELEHKRSIAEQFTQLQKARGSKGYDERLLSFRGMLDADEDVYFIRATEADPGGKPGAVRRR